MMLLQRERAAERVNGGSRARHSCGAAQRPAYAPAVVAPRACDDTLARLLRTACERRSPAVAPEVAGPVLQRYELVAPHEHATRLPEGHYRVFGGDAEFEAQEVETVPRRAISAPRAPAALPALRASDDARMAVEHTNLTRRQPKVFYAVPAVIADANRKLADAGSDYELYVDRPNAIRVKLASGTQRSLDRILPRTRAVPEGGRLEIHGGMTLMVGPDCVETAKQLMKHANAKRMPRLGFEGWEERPDTDYSDLRTARAFAAWVKTEKKRAATGVSGKFWKWATSADAEALSEFGKTVTRGTLLDMAVMRRIATSYAEVMRDEPDLAARAAERFGVNLHAAADVGEAYETYRISGDTTPTTRDTPTGPVRDFWAQHIGAVVARSASGDTVTLENYARTQELPGGVGYTPAHYYFQMYGPTSKPQQTWHHAWTAPNSAGAPVGTPGHGGRDALTVVVRSGT
jgi:hypothetical protein